MSVHRGAIKVQLIQRMFSVKCMLHYPLSMYESRYNSLAMDRDK